MIPVHVPIFSGNEKQYLEECISSGWVSSEGPFVERFESAIATYTGRTFAAAVSSGTAALELAVRALGLSPGDEIIMPALTIISCAAAVVRSGAVPVLVDSDPNTFNMSAEDIRKKITPRTRAIMVVHLYGLPCEMEEIQSIAQEYKLRIIEDAAEVLGQSYRGTRCGKFGDVSVFSFYANKIVTTGEGGMVLTDDPEIINNVRSLRNLAFDSERRFEHTDLGWNYRLSNLQAAVGLAQFEKLSENLAKKKFLAQVYWNELSSIPALQLPLSRIPEAENVYWVYPVVLTSAHAATEAMAYLKERKIASRPFFKPMHEQPVFRKLKMFSDDRHPVAERLFRKGLYLPFGPGIAESQVKEVCRCLSGFLR